MITEILNLGIKGDKLVATALKNIQKAKELFKKPENLSVSMIKPGAGGNPTFTPAPSEKKEEDKKEEDKKEKDEEGKKYNWESAKGDIKSGISAIGGMDTKALITGLGHSLDVWTVGVSGILAEMGGAAITFKDKIKQSAQLVGDTQSLNNIANRYDVSGNYFPDKNNKENALLEKRSDISKSERSGIVEAIGSSMGKITPEFRKAIDKLYGANEKGQTAYDVRETTAIAQGNFAATGTDTGFFLQKISDSFSGLPPSIRQALQGQLIGMVPEKDRAKQKDQDIRAINTGFDNRERNKASEMIANGNIGRAIKIDEIQKAIDIGMAKSIGTLSDALTKAAKLINDNVNKANTMEVKKGSAWDISKATFG